MFSGFLHFQEVSKIYKSYEFTYAGISSEMFGMYVCDIGSKTHNDNSFGNKANIVETRLPGRITPIHFGVRYHDEPLAFPLIFAADEEMDRYQMQEIAKWLTGYQDYQWLTIGQPDMEHLQFKCLIHNLTPVSVGRIPVAFEADIVCDCPYAYSYPFAKKYSVSSTSEILFYNDSTCRVLLKPKVTIEVAAGCTEFSINNTTSGQITAFSGLPGGALRFVMDNENCVITEEIQGLNPYKYFNFEFFGLEPGDNQLVVSGKGTVTIEGQYLYNVGA